MHLHQGYVDDAPSGPFDAATCLLTLHFLDREERRRTAGEIHRSLVRHGHRPGSDDEVVLLGWSGGGQIALGAAWYLEAMGLKVSVLSLGGMLSDDIALARIDHLWHLYGTKDFLQASGKLLFAGRWPAAKKSPWNEALAQGKISMIELGPYNHNVKEHYFDYESKLPSGTSYAVGLRHRF